MNKHPLGNLSIAAMLLVGVLVSTGIAAQNTSNAFVIGERLEIESKILDETRNLIIGTPPNYESSEDSYPVLIVLDGPDHFHHITGITRFLAVEGRLPGIIVVAIANTDRGRDLSSPSQVKAEIDAVPTHGGADNFARFLGDELIPWVDANYRTLPYTILFGHSNGGRFAINTLVTRPEIFDAYIAISPTLQWNNESVIAQADAFFEATSALDADLFMTTGDEGGRLLDGIQQLSHVLDRKAPKGFRWDFNLLPGESHFTVTPRSTYQGLEYIFSGWYLSDPVALFDQSGIEAIEEFYEASGKKFGYERKIPRSVLMPILSQLVRTDRVDEAAAITLRDLQAYSPPPWLANMMATVYVNNGRQEQGIDYFDRLLEADPGNESVPRALAELRAESSAANP